MKNHKVDSEQLRSLGEHMTDVSKWDVTHGLDSIEGATDDYGHHGIGAWVSTRTQGWADTLSRLADTVRHGGDLLTGAAKHYDDAEDAVRGSMRPGGQ